MEQRSNNTEHNITDKITGEEVKQDEEVNREEEVKQEEEAQQEEVVNDIENTTNSENNVQVNQEEAKQGENIQMYTEQK